MRDSVVARSHGCNGLASAGEHAQRRAAVALDGVSEIAASKNGPPSESGHRARRAINGVPVYSGGRMTSTVTVRDRGFFGHPRGLSTLFMTEMWERFSYYGMRALLILFLTAEPDSGGLGFDTSLAGAIYGLYTSMVYMTSLPGGWIADRLIGQRRAVLYGGVIIATGQFCLAFPSLTTFYAGLTFIVIGTGLLKANVSVMVGQLYGPDDHRRDAGFSIFYMGINIGAFIAPLVCGYLGQRVNWHVGFAAAGVGMVLGVVQYVLGSKYLGEAGLHPASTDSPAAAARLRVRVQRWGAAVAMLVVLVALGLYAGIVPVSAQQVANGAGYLLLATTVLFFGWLFFAGEWTPDERKRLYAIGVFFVAAALFWSEFEQAGSTLNLFADRNTRTSVFGWAFPSSWFQSVNSLFIIALAPVFAWLWVRLGRREPSSPTKFSFGLVFVGAGFAVLTVASMISATGVRVSPSWLVVTYLLHTVGELSLSPVGLSAMTKLAPARVAGLMMGVWFLATSVGNFIGGRLTSLYESWPLAGLFGAVGAFGVGAGLVMLALARPIKRLMGGVR
jgi:POT family proton-dependent oligopeptide transporter